MQFKTFENIVVYPTQKLLRPPYLLFRGGPDWPHFWQQVAARHCRFRVPIPLDLRPRRDDEPVAVESVGVWCGPVSDHFGHAIADFGGRIARSSQLPAAIPLVFSAAPGQPVPSFLYELLALFGVGADRVRVITRPTKFQCLLVQPQAERLHARRTDASYLDLLDKLTGDAPPGDASRLFVSRAGRPGGRFAAIGYLEDVLGRAGYQPFRPELHSLKEQLDRYRRASKIVFSEGSAIHALQLLGRIRASVTIIVRRPRSRIARELLMPRVASLNYVESLEGLVHGVRLDGKRQPSAGISLLDQHTWLPALKRAGIDLEGQWDPERYLLHRNTDLEAWLRHRRTRPSHPSEGAVIGRTMRSAGLSRQAVRAMMAVADRTGA